jgi:hypothetical protein
VNGRDEDAPRRPLDTAALRRIGIFPFDDLAERADSTQACRIEGLVPMCSIGVRIGDSNLGKTPLSMQEGICIAAGRPFLGHAVRQGRVLYCDGESGLSEVVRSMRAISGFLGLSAPPVDFHVWSPNLDPRDPLPDETIADLLCEKVNAVQPDHVVLDPLRVFFPEAEEGTSEATSVIRRLRLLTKEIGCSWAINHHRRKRDFKRTVRIEQDRHEWFEEAAGSLALINGTDVRVGLERRVRPPGDLTMAGFVRSLGWWGPVLLERVLDDDGEPRAYKVLAGVGLLNDNYRAAFERLAGKFRFKDAHAALGGTSDSNTAEFLKQCITASVLKKEGSEYLKVESVE